MKDMIRIYHGKNIVVSPLGETNQISMLRRNI